MVPQFGTVTQVLTTQSTTEQWTFQPSSNGGVLHRVCRTRAESDSRLSGKFNCEAFSLKSMRLLSVTGPSFDFLQASKKVWSAGAVGAYCFPGLIGHGHSDRLCGLCQCNVAPFRALPVFQKPSMSPKVAILRWKRLLVDGVFGRVRAASLPVFPLKLDRAVETNRTNNALPVTLLNVDDITHNCF